MFPVCAPPRAHAQTESEMWLSYFTSANETKKSRYSQPLLTVRRQFKIKNSGLTSVYVRGFDIEGSECEGYGFRVLNCDGFSLAPDEQRDVDIAFTPDFTLSLLSRTLSVRSSLGGDAATLNYTIEASVPYHMLAVCSQALPRPAWEPYLFYSLNSFMVFVLVCVAVAIYTESDRVAKSSMMMFVQRPEQQQQHQQQQQQQQHQHHQQQSYEGSNGVFDLRGIQSQVNQELNLRQRSNAASANGASNSPGTGTGRGRSGNRGSPPQSAPPNRESGTPGALSNGKFFEGIIHREQQKNHEKDLWIMQLISWPAERLSSGFKWLLKLPILLSGWRSSLSPPVATASPPTSNGTKNSKADAAAGNRETTPGGGKQSSSAAATPVPQGKKAKRRQQQLARRQLSRKASYEEVETASNTTESSNVDEDFGERSNHNHHNNTKGTSSNHDLSSSFSQLPPAVEQINGKKGNAGQRGKGASAPAGGKKVAPAPVLPVEDGTKKNSSKPKKSNESKQQEQNKGKEQQQQQQKKQESNSSKAKDSSSAKGINSKLQTATDTQRHQKLAKSDSNGISNRSSSGVAFDKPPRMQQQVKIGQDSGHNNQDLARNQHLHQSHQQQQQQQKPKVPPPVGKILPEPKRMENVGAQYGAIGSSVRGAGVGMPRKSTWSDSPAEAKPLPHAHSMFGPIAAANNGVAGAPPPPGAADMSVPPPTPPTPQEPSDSYARYQQPPPSAPGTPSPSYLPGSPAHAQAANNNGVASSSLMQSLQAERRQRTEEYMRAHPQTATSPDWPGFEHQFGGAGDFINNLWDNPVSQQGRGPLPPHNNGGGGIAAGQSNWGVSEDIWPNAYPLNLQQQLGNGGGGVGVGEAGNFGGVNRSNNLFDHMNSFNYVPAASAGDSIWDAPVKEQQQQHQQSQSNGGGGGDRSNNTWATLFNKEPTT